MTPLDIASNNESSNEETNAIAVKFSNIVTSSVEYVTNKNVETMSIIPDIIRKTMQKLNLLLVVVVSPNIMSKSCLSVIINDASCISF